MLIQTKAAHWKQAVKITVEILEIVYIREFNI